MRLQGSVLVTGARVVSATAPQWAQEWALQKKREGAALLPQYKGAVRIGSLMVFKAFVRTEGDRTVFDFYY